MRFLPDTRLQTTANHNFSRNFRSSCSFKGKDALSFDHGIRAHHRLVIGHPGCLSKYSMHVLRTHLSKDSLRKKQSSGGRLTTQAREEVYLQRPNKDAAAGHGGSAQSAAKLPSHKAFSAQIVCREWSDSSAGYTRCFRRPFLPRRGLVGDGGGGAAFFGAFFGFDFSPSFLISKDALFSDSRILSRLSGSLQQTQLSSTHVAGGCQGSEDWPGCVLLRGVIRGCCTRHGNRAVEQEEPVQGAVTHECWLATCFHRGSMRMASAHSVMSNTCHPQAVTFSAPEAMDHYWVQRHVAR